jgi:hypothetical protein
LANAPAFAVCEGGPWRYLPALAAARAAFGTEPMALHRDIFWVGRQWAVTGYGIQACNQKQKGQFDIEGSRLWEDGVQESLRAEAWFNVEDFEKAVEVARKYYPEPPREAAAISAEIPDLKQANSKAISDRERRVATPKDFAGQTFELHVDSWPAKFVQTWRINTRP